jgi:hypothetical protein
LALVSCMLFAPIKAQSAPLICSGPTGLVYVLAASCTAASLGVLPGFTVGNCLVVQSDFSLGGGACGGGGGSNFPTGITTGVPGIDGPFAVVASLGGPVTFSTSSTTGVGPYFFGNDLLITDSVNGPIVVIDNAGDAGFAGAFTATAINATNGFNVVGTQTRIGVNCCPQIDTLGGGLQLILTINSGMVGGTAMSAVDQTGNSVSGSYHCNTSNQDGIPAVGASTAIQWSSLGTSFVGQYTLVVNDNGPIGFADPTVTAKTVGGFTFTSTNFATDTYSYLACGD